MRLNRLFSDNLVLQRDAAVPVWGTAEAGDTITVAFAGQTKQATASPAGNWRVTFDPLSVSCDCRALVVSSKITGQVTTVAGVLVGEVWICSGQSNMEMTVSSCLDRDAEIQAAEYPLLRMFTVPRLASQTPQTDTTGAWAACSPATVGNFSAVGYFFARELQQRLGGIPVGMIHTSWGGTVVEAWTSREGLRAVPEARGIVERTDRWRAEVEPTAAYAEQLAAWKHSIPTDPGDTGWAQGWATLDAPAEGWKPFPVPGAWQLRGCNFSGIFWFRREVEIPAAWAGHDLILKLGPCDKSDITWFNNAQVGSITMEQRGDAWSVPRQYQIPGALVHAGRNVIAVRIFSNMYAGGFTGAPGDMHLACGDQKLPLAGTLAHRIEQNFGVVNPQPPEAPFGDQGQHAAAALYNSMIAPLIPYALRGTIWYQGESNAGRAHEYTTLFPAMIRDWRTRWGYDFPFHFVQLANWMAEQPEPGDSAWAELREAQRLTLREPNTGMAVIIDIGDAADIHPPNKQDVGRRLAYAALAQAHGQTLPSSGPVLRDWSVAGSLVRLRFDHAGDGGLVTHDGGPLRGVAIAGANRSFVWAWARIEGDTIVARHPRVPNPVAVRYAWADNPSCNLANAAGFPASPFRSDDWPWITEGAT